MKKPNYLITLNKYELMAGNNIKLTSANEREIFCSELRIKMVKTLRKKLCCDYFNSGIVDILVANEKTH